MTSSLRPIELRTCTQTIYKSSKHSPFFDKWLDLMAEAFEVLDREAFYRLEEKITEQIEISRKTRPMKTTEV
jgi:hypothetical protein